MRGKQRSFVASSATLMADLQSAKKEWSRKLLQSAPVRATGARAFAENIAGVDPGDNVVGVGTGEKIVDGKPTGQNALKFFVKIKYPKEQLTAKSLLPTQVSGLPVDVEEVGVFRAFRQPNRARRVTASAGTMPNPKARWRPAQPGSSCGFADPAGMFTMAGTFGALVRTGGSNYILSNNHVLADENQLPLGSAIFQPGLLDGGHNPQDKIAVLSKFIPLKAGVANKVDCAIAKLTPQSIAIRDILYIGPPQGTAVAAIDMIVQKFGRTTSYRAGRILSIDTDVKVGYETGTYLFVNQIIIRGLNSQAFSAAGDSGSLILERSTRKAVSLLFAGSSTHTIGNHIQDVLSALHVVLA
jgi:hypothetical protein